MVGRKRFEFEFYDPDRLIDGMRCRVFVWRLGSLQQMSFNASTLSRLHNMLSLEAPKKEVVQYVSSMTTFADDDAAGKPGSGRFRW